eukprot:15407258-Alexandrium_andersonii.AAC.1
MELGTGAPGSWGRRGEAPGARGWRSARRAPGGPKLELGAGISLDSWQEFGTRAPGSQAGARHGQRPGLTGEVRHGELLGLPDIDRH